MDGRIALAPGAVLRLKNVGGYTDYTIQNEVGRGGSCIVYDASYRDNIGNYKLVRIKECYPHALHMTRADDGTLVPRPQDVQAFERAKERLKQAYQKNHDLFYGCPLTNAVANSCDICKANGSVYVISVFVNGQTFARHPGETLHDCVSLLLGTARAIRHIHDAGYLYLDLKPENILTLAGSPSVVQLFDFDSMISLNEIENAVPLRTSCSKGFAPWEQQSGRLRLLGRHSDVYSLGAVFFHALWHRTPTAFDGEYDWKHMAYAAGDYRDALYPALRDFFRRTLASYHGDRYRSMDEAIFALEEILRLSDRKALYVCSSGVAPNAVFYGREGETEQLRDMLNRSRRGIACLCGMGGIGKSSLVRQYLALHAQDWDAVVWIYDREGLFDDTQLRVSTVRRMKEETGEDYLKRKLEAVARAASEQRILLVADNFELARLPQAEKLRHIGWTMLLISRERPPEGLLPTLVLAEPDEETLQALFEHYSQLELRNGDDRTRFREIIAALGRHTLLTELIACQIAKSRLTLEQARDLIADCGLRGLPGEKIDYIRDRSAVHDTLMHILDCLTQAERFTQDERQALKLLSLIGMPGIDAPLFKKLSGIETLDVINDLESGGWVKAQGQKIFLHPLMQEYVRTWPWTPLADTMMQKLYDMIRPAGERHDGSKQFPTDYNRLYGLLCLADRLLAHCERESAASRHLLCRLLIDAPVDRDAAVLERMLHLLENPVFLDDDSILRLYETAAYLASRLCDPESSLEILGRMKRYLEKHPSAYYLSAYHRATAVVLHNADQDGNLQTCLRHEGRAVAAARLSRHPDAKKQLAACLLDKATTLLSADIKRSAARSLIARAKPLIDGYTAETDYERYQFDCVAAMCAAMDGESEAAVRLLRAADAIAFSAPDSVLSVAEHLIEQHAPICMALGRYRDAARAVESAIEQCRQHEDIRRYRETISDAYRFLGDICAESGDCAGAAAAYAEAESRMADAPYPCELPPSPNTKPPR